MQAARSRNCNWTCRVAKYHALTAPAEDGTPGAGYPAGRAVDWDAVAEEIRLLREKIQRLGNVNLDAISEQDELEQLLRNSSAPR